MLPEERPGSRAGGGNNLAWRVACLILALLVLVLSSHVYQTSSTGPGPRTEFGTDLLASLEKQGIKDEGDLERLVYGDPSAGGGFNFPELLSERREQLLMEVHDALEIVKLHTGAPVYYVSLAANKWFRSEASKNVSWSMELSDPRNTFARQGASAYRARAFSHLPSGWVAGEFVWELGVECPDPVAPKETGKQVLFAGVVVTLILEDRGKVKVRVTLEKEDAPGGWSKTLGDRIIKALKGIVDLEKRGVQVEIGYK